jgi:hypothetical protein
MRTYVLIGNCPLVEMAHESKSLADADNSILRGAPMRAKQYSSVPLPHLYIGACMYIECARDGFVYCALYAYRACARWLCSIVRVSVAACPAFMRVNAMRMHGGSVRAGNNMCKD